MEITGWLFMFTVLSASNIPAHTLNVERTDGHFSHLQRTYDTIEDCLAESAQVVASYIKNSKAHNPEFDTSLDQIETGLRHVVILDQSVGLTITSVCVPMTNLD